MVTLKRILTPTDFSTVTVPAVGYALSLARDLGAEVSVLHVLPTEAMRQNFANQYAPGDLGAPTAGPVGVARQPDLEGLFERKRQVIHSFLEQRISSDLLSAANFKAVVKIGKVASEIVAVAKEEQSDLIVMASHGSRLKRLLRGSVNDRVLRSAPCPVLSIQPWAEIRTEENKRVAVRLIEKWAA